MSRVAVVALLLSSGAFAQSHRGSLGLIVGTGGDFSTLVSGVGDDPETGMRVPIDVGATLGLTNKSELIVTGRFAPGVFGVSPWGLSFYGGLRQSFGYEQWKTFFDLQLAIHAVPYFTAGARVAFGVQYDVADIAGVYAQVGAQLGGALVLRLGAELIIGVQFRTYLFE